MLEIIKAKIIEARVSWGSRNQTQNVWHQKQHVQFMKENSKLRLHDREITKMYLLLSQIGGFSLSKDKGAVRKK